MKRRVFAFLMAFVMLCSVVPTEAFAWWGNGGGNWGPGGGTSSSNGENLGWEYADVRELTSGGYKLFDPQSSSYETTLSRAGYSDPKDDLSQYVTVTYSGDTSGNKWVESSTGRKDGIIADDSTKSVTITCDPAYYIEWVVLACGHNGTQNLPFSCNTVASDEGVGWKNTSASFNSVTLSMADLYEHANHASGNPNYYLMIEIAPLPAPVHVGYFVGSTAIDAAPVKDTGNLPDGGIHVSNNEYETWYYGTAASPHTVLDINPAAEAKANEQGYSFAGWKLEYFREYSDGSSKNEFTSSTAIGRDNVPAGERIELTVHATLTAIWQPLQTVTVSKVWSDNDNQDGIRPESVEIHLLKNGVHTGDKLTLSDANSWAGEWKVPAKDENGLDIAWSVAEEAPSGYTAVVTGNEESGFVVTNSHSPETRVVNVQKVWDDDNDRDGKRPVDGVYVRLYRVDGEKLTAVGDAVELIRANTWTHQWTELTKYEAGEEIEYTVREVDASGNPISGDLNNGYTHDPAADIVWDMDDQGNIRTNLVEVINHYTPETIDISVEKTWDDGNNQDGKRTTSVEVTLKADGDTYLVNGAPYTITLTEGTNGKWVGTFENVHKYHNAGTEIVYSVEETSPLPEGYSVSISGSAAAGFEITNKYTPETTSVTVVKEWDDGSNQDGLRPNSITVTLYANGTAVATEVIAYTDNWQHTFADLPKKADGTEITYTVAETAAEGYTISGNKLLDADGAEVYTIAVDGYTITNTHAVATADFSVTKVWNDGNNQDGKRPYAVIVALCINGEPVETNPNDNITTDYKYTVTLTEENNLTGTWPDLPLYSNGQRISYSVEEVGHIKSENGEIEWSTPEGYSVDHSYKYTNTIHEATVTNSYTPEKTTLNVRKVWNDDHNRAGVRPSQLTLELWKSVDGGETWTNTGRTTTTTTTTWAASFANLPKYENGVEIQYTVKEQDACLDADGKAASLAELGYTFDGCVVDGQTATLTNSRETEYVSVTANKTWVDNDDQDGIRPGSIIVYLYANGKLCYEVDPAKVDAEGNPLPVFHEVTVAADGTWSTSFVNLYKHYNQTEIVYTVVEAEVPGYTTEYEKTIDSDGNVTVEVINTHELAQTDVTVTKLWEDNHDQDGIRPPSVKVQLLANGTVVREANLTASAGGWTHTFVGLPVYDGTVDAYGNPVPIRYTVTEDAVSGYETTIDGFIITNTHVPAETEVSVTKIWDDEENQDGKRPESITLYLYANGSLVDSYTYTDGSGNEVTVYGTVLVEADADGKWGYTWEHLDKNAGGKEINYTVYEGRVEDYIEHTVHTSNSVTITNSYDPQKTFFIVQKVWDDNSNQDLARPASIYVQLYADGVAYGDPVGINLNSNWKHEWSDLDLMANGKQIVYTVQEGYLDGEGAFVIGLPDEIKDDYYLNTEKTGEKNGVYEIINTLIPDTTEVTVIKNWVDNGNQDGLRPDSITVELYANGDPTGKTAELSEANSWHYTFAGLTKNHNLGQEIVYTVKEPDVPTGYTSVVGEIEDGQIEVTNTHIPETTAITVSKAWNDSNNQDGLRPEEISFILYQTVNGVKTPVDKSLYTDKIQMSKNWEATLSGLPKYAGGVEIQYSVEEAAVEGYGVSIDGLTITNSHTPSTIDIPVKKIWEDAENQDGKRPYGVIAYLLRNGQSTGKWIELTAENNWEGVFQDLPEYVEGQKISYTVIETSHRVKKGNDLTAGMPEGYSVDYPIEGGVHQLVNSYKPEVTFLNVQKIWDDDNNRAGKRPASISVTLYANGEEYRDAEGNSYVLTLSPANEWDATFSGMPKYSGGQPVTYTVVETALDAALGYKAPSYSYNSTLGTMFVTNTREIEYINVSVSKVWDDALNGVEDNDGLRPEKVTVYLYANGILCNQVDEKGNAILDSSGNKIPVSAELSKSNGWAHTFQKLHKNYQGKEVSYSVKEAPVEGYTTEVSSIDSEGKIKVTNTHVPATTEITVQKVWDDANDQDDVRPTRITVVLLADGKEIASQDITAADGWQYTFKNLPVYKGQKDADGNPVAIEYTVQEKEECLDVNGKATTLSSLKYDTVRYEATSTGYRITNARVPEVTTLTATKIWDDNNDQDGKRPETVVLHLLADGVHLGEGYKITLDGTVDESEASAWVAEWKNLPKYASGKQIRYTVYEEPAYFKGTVSASDAQSGIAIASDDRYDAVYERESQDMTDPNFYKVKVTNVYVPETVDLEVMKVWQDDNDRDGLRPASLVVDLYADGVKIASETIQPKEPEDTSNENAKYDWKCIFENLPKYKAGKQIVYTVTEASADGYTLHVDGKVHTGAVALDTHTGMFVLTNVHNPDTTGVAVRKVWEDEENNDGKRPEYIEVALKADGQIVEGSTVRLSDANRWTHVWTEINGEPLYVRNNGSEIKYEAVEIAVPDGYAGENGTPVKHEGQFYVTITNTHATEKMAVSVEKVWEDANDNDGFRPDSIQISLYRGETKVDTYKDASGNDVPGTVTLNEANGWSYTWSGLYVYTGGQKITYTVKEEAFENQDQYDTQYSQIDSTGKITVTNTHVPLTWKPVVTKVWNDSNNKAKQRPTSITAQLYKDGVAYTDAFKLNAANNWSKTFDDLPLYENGKKIDWTVKETEVPKSYYASYAVSYDKETMTITNTATTTPKTGDSFDFGMWMTMLFTSGAAALLFLLPGKKKGKYVR